MNSIFAEAAELCAAGTPFVWASILSQDGSTPRSAGSRMLVLADGIVSTIGGGGMEAGVIAMARDSVLKDRKPQLMHYDMSGTEAATAGLICGGVCEVLLAYMEAAYGPVLEAAARAEADGTPAWLFYILDENPGTDLPFQLCLNVGGEKLVGSFRGNQNFMRQMLLNPIRVAIHGDMVDGVRFFAQDVGSAPRMFLFGAGHVSCEVAKIAVGCGFNVTVVDDRADFCNAERFPGCGCAVIESFERMPDFPADEASYVIIMTRGHSYDKDVLRWALGKKPFYLGMIGSRSKRDTLYRKLHEEEGFPMEQLQAVFCPIGLSIGAETPAEIAVSVMAEVIQKRRQVPGGK
ncbi:MAG: XdhC family protein [Oscillospiraceae bacterium]|nr:XdhC family protein [Oscillospiraceae bacterium]MBR4692631.1 XdhC family protein [Oscillospiraceae bacterium]